jgi:pimeloyl-ACP methyl ester carboxylesterase
VLEAGGKAREVHVVLGGRSSAVPDADKRRYRELEARSQGAVLVHDLPNAGHWVHADDPEGLLAVMRPALST